jgi:asparagine synthase (glutamine-hydrolysing)
LGADELFGGYANTFQGMPRLVRALKLAHALPGGTALARQAIDVLPQRYRWAKLRDALHRDVSPMSAYLAWRGLFSPSEVRDLVTPDVWSEAVETFDPIRYIGSHADGKGEIGSFDTQPFAWSSRAELGTYLHSQLLRDTDVMSMAHSLEVRVPFLDHRLVEAVLRLPARFHRGAGSPKPLLRSAIEHALPPMIGRRPGKQGFTFPFADWMRGSLRGAIEPVLEDTPAAHWLSRNAVRTIWRDFEAGRVHWSRPWSIVCLQGWGLHSDG